MRIELLGLALVAALVFPAPAAAHDHKIPEAQLVTEQDSGPGDNYVATWAQRTGGRCAVSSAPDGVYWWASPPIEWVPATGMAVRFETRHKPARVITTAFLFGDPTTGTPIYGQIDIAHELRKVEVDGETMWEAVLSPPPWPDLWLDVWARWPDQDGCHPQVAGWRFRASLLPI